MSVTLNNGVIMPLFGLGTWQSPEEETIEAVKAAIACGYTHIDTATIYGYEQAVGKGIKESGIERDKLFVTTKLWNTMHHPDDVEEALDYSLNQLNLNYVDLWLMHYPCANDRAAFEKDGSYIKVDIDYCETWKKMEEMLLKGKCRAIGISNFSKAETQRLLDNCRIKPQVHQMEMHPYLEQNEFLQFHKDHGIHVTAYSPFGNQNESYQLGGELRLFEHPKVVEMAKKLNVSPASILIAWALKRGTSVIPKSVKPERIEANLRSNDVILKEEDMQILSNFGFKKRYSDFGPFVGYEYYRDLECPGKKP